MTDAMTPRSLAIAGAAFAVLVSGCLRFHRDDSRRDVANDHQISSAIAGAFECARAVECEVPAGLELLLVSWGEWVQYSVELYRDGTVKFTGGSSQACSGAYVGRVEPEAVAALLGDVARDVEPFVGESYSNFRDATLVRVRLRSGDDWIVVENAPSSGNTGRFASVVSEIHRVAHTTRMAEVTEYRRSRDCAFLARW